MTALSRKEEALWLFQRIAPESGVDNLPFAIETSAQIDLAILTDAVRELARRYPALRAVFGISAGDGGVPTRTVITPERLVVPVEGFETTQAGLASALGEFARRPFDLTREVPFRVGRFAVAGGGSVICLIAHHIACDGQSGGIMMPELCGLYVDLAAGREPAPPAAQADPSLVAQFREQPPSAESLRYWLDQLEGFDPARLALHGARPDPAVATFAGGRFELDLYADCAPDLDSLRRRMRATENMVMLAAYFALLARHGAGPDLVVAVPASTRGDCTRAAVGYHINTLPIRVHVDLRGSFRQLVREVRARMIGGLSHSDVSFENLLGELHLGEVSWRAPLFRHMFNFHPASVIAERGPLPDADWTIVDPGVSRHDVHFAVLRIPDRTPDRVKMQVEYSTEIHDEAYARALAERYELLVRAVVADPDRPLAELDLWRPAERALVDQINAAAGTLPAAEHAHAVAAASVQAAAAADVRAGADVRAAADVRSVAAGVHAVAVADGRTVAAVIAERIAACPQAVALIEPGDVAALVETRDVPEGAEPGDRPAGALTGRAPAGNERRRAWLSGRAAVIRERLASVGVGHGDVVALAVPRSADLAAAVLATWSLGAAYLPLDPAQPVARMAGQLADAQVPAVVAAAELPAECVAGRQLLRLDTLDTRDTLNTRDTLDIRDTVDTRANDAPHAMDAPDELLAGLAKLTGDDLAYTIFTSGSTGRPKGVEITHRSLANLVTFFSAYLNVGESDRVLWLTTFGFDISALELFLPLCHGGAIVVADNQAQTSPSTLLGLVTTYDVGVVQTTPTIWRLVAGQLGDELAGRRVLCGGEPMSATLARQLLRSGCRLYNVYGPTETTIWSTATEITGDVTDPVGVGGPISATTLFVVDEYGQDAPPGIVGELWIGGASVARGYTARPELTEQRFVSDPRRGRCYRTGDLATWRPDGTIELLGRADRQIKLRGRRIELGEIETALERHPAVAAAAVVVQGDSQSDGRLVGFLQPAEPGEQAGDGLIADVGRHATAVLPFYLVPAVLVPVEKLPRNASGKVDYRALPAVSAPQDSDTGDAAPADPLEQELVEVWAEVLGSDDLGVLSNFFACGGHSLLAAVLVTRIAERTGLEASLPDVFGAPTPRELAAVLRGLTPAA